MNLNESDKNVNLLNDISVREKILPSFPLLLSNSVTSKETGKNSKNNDNENIEAVKEENRNNTNIFTADSNNNYNNSNSSEHVIMNDNNYSKHNISVTKSKSVNRYFFKTFPEFINYKYKRRFLCDIYVLFVPTTMLIFHNLVKFLKRRGASRLLNNLYPLALILGLMISFESTGMTEAGTCWIKRAENGKCKEIFSKNMSKEECCSRSSEFAYTEKDLSDAEFFFATALGGGANCLSCLDSCDVAKCPPGKRCVIRKGRPKCICAPLCKGSKEKKLKKNSILVLAANTNEKLTDFEFGFPLSREIRSLNELTKLLPSQGENMKLENERQSRIAKNKKENNNDNNYSRNRKRDKKEKRRKKNQRKLSSSHDFNDNNYSKSSNNSHKSYNNKVKSYDYFNSNYKSADSSNNNDGNISYNSRNQSELNLKELNSERNPNRHHHHKHSQHRHHEEIANDENSKVQNGNEFKTRKNIFKRPSVKNISNRERKDFELPVGRKKLNSNFVNIVNYASNNSENHDVEGTDFNHQNRRQQHHKRHQFNRRKHHQRQHQHRQQQQQNGNYSKMQSENVTGITTTEILLLDSNSSKNGDRKRTDLIKDNSKFSFRILNSTNANSNNGNSGDTSSNISSTSRNDSNKSKIHIDDNDGSSSSAGRQKKKANNNGSNKRKQQNSSFQQSTSSRQNYSNKIMGLDEKIRNGFFNHGFPYPLNDHLIVPQQQQQQQVVPGRYFNPVCGTDGKTYKTECQLKKRACRRESTSLMVAYRGHCQTSCKNVQCVNGLSCVEDQYGIPHCIACSITCPRDDLLSPVIDPTKAVCGVDRRTYKSVCDINRMICLTGRSIGIAYNGPCQEEANCNTIHCGDRKICLTDLVTHRPRCVTCSFKCPRKRRPQGERYEDTKICGNNNHTYHSWCQMRRDSCNTEFYIDVKHVGACHKDSFPSDGLFQS